MPFTSRNALIAAMASTAYTALIHRTAVQSGNPWSDWMSNGVPATSGIQPNSTAVTCNLDTPGAIDLKAPAAGKQLYLTSFTYTGASSTNVAITLYDRAAHVGAKSATNTSPQTANVAAHPRFTSTVGVYAYVEVYSNIGGGLGSTSTWSGMTISYTNSDGVAGRTGNLPKAGFPSSSSSTTGLFLPFQLQAGDVGVASVQSVTVPSPTTLAGSFGITLARPLLSAERFNSGAATRRGWTGLIELGTSPCLFFASNRLAVGVGTISTVEGPL